MIAYSLSQLERAMSGFTDLYILKVADLAVFTNGTAVKLSALAAGDIVFPSKMLQEVRTLVLGPTGAPTASVGITGAVTQFTAASTVMSGTQQVVPTAAAPYVVTAATNLLVDLEAGGGNGAAATAGEIWIWASISRAADRSVLKG